MGLAEHWLRHVRRALRRGIGEDRAAPGPTRRGRKLDGKEEVVVKSILRRLLTGDSGQDLVEYALLAALIATVSVMALGTMGVAVSDFYKRLTDTFAGF
jgi:Flp pilus assembly pilin Flp